MSLSLILSIFSTVVSITAIALTFSETIVRKKETNNIPINEAPLKKMARLAEEKNISDRRQQEIENMFFRGIYITGILAVTAATFRLFLEFF